MGMECTIKSWFGRNLFVSSKNWVSYRIDEEKSKFRLDLIALP